MHWEKKGLIYAPNGQSSWAKQYAIPATPYLVNDQVLRIYTSFCDENMVGRAAFVEVDANNPSRILRVAEKPVLDIGQPGDFDDNGVAPTCVLSVGDKVYMYYVGFQLGRHVRYMLFQGLAISDDGGLTFRRHARVPVVDRSDSETHFRTAAFVMHDQGLFKMWYTAGNSWTEVKGKALPVYNTRYIESHDGINWPRQGQVCVDFANADEHAIARPWVLKSAEGYRMFYCIRSRSKGYRLGYAKSADGVKWQRRDEELGMDVSSSGWDSTGMAYPAALARPGRTYLFHCGNNCGSTGFGYAVSAE